MKRQRLTKKLRHVTGGDKNGGDVSGLGTVSGLLIVRRRTGDASVRSEGTVIRWPTWLIRRLATASHGEVVLRSLAFQTDVPRSLAGAEAQPLSRETLQRGMYPRWAGTPAWSRVNTQLVVVMTASAARYIRGLGCVSKIRGEARAAPCRGGGRVSHSGCNSARRRWRRVGARAAACAGGTCSRSRYPRWHWGSVVMVPTTRAANDSSTRHARRRSRSASAGRQGRRRWRGA